MHWIYYPTVFNKKPCWMSCNCPLPPGADRKTVSRPRIYTKHWGRTFCSSVPVADTTVAANCALKRAKQLPCPIGKPRRLRNPPSVLIPRCLWSAPEVATAYVRSEERRVGKEGRDGGSEDSTGIRRET